MQRGNHAFDRVVKQHRADAEPDIELEVVGVGEERLVLADGLALVVENGPAAAYPARTEIVCRHLGMSVGPDDDLALASRLAGPARPGFSSGFRGRSHRSRRS